MAKLTKGKSAKLKELAALDSSVGKSKNIDWEAQQVQAESDILLTNDIGQGKTVLIRNFDFEANPEAFKVQVPTKQELFDHHARGIKAFLWRDGLRPIEYIDPKLVISKDNKGYRIFIACEPMSNQTVLETPNTLSQIANGSR